MKPKRIDSRCLRSYPKHTAMLRYVIGGATYEWFIGADPKHDNAITLADHLKYHLPRATLIAWSIK